MRVSLLTNPYHMTGGPFVLPLAREYGVNILPADSEHSAIFQCLQVCEN